MTSNEESLVEMKLIELSSNNTITFPCQVDSKTAPNEAPYDIILGSDFMEALGINIEYSDLLESMRRKGVRGSGLQYYLGFN